MSYDFINLDKPAVAGAGAATPKDPNVFIARTKDVLTWPMRDSKGVLLEGDLVFKDGYSAITVYMTGVNQKPNFAIEGDVDKEQIMQKFEATRPGDELEAHEFLQNVLGEDLVIFYRNCDTDTTRMYGTPCAPLRLKGGFEDSKDGRGFTFNFEQIQATRFVPAHYKGTVPTAAPYASSVLVPMLQANGTQYKIEALAVTDAILGASLDFPHGSIITLIGSGGAGPAVLSSGDFVTATAILVDDQDWTAVENATITLKVYNAGATTYLIEQSRS